MFMVILHFLSFKFSSCRCKQTKNYLLFVLYVHCTLPAFNRFSRTKKYSWLFCIYSPILFYLYRRKLTKNYLLYVLYIHYTLTTFTPIFEDRKRFIMITLQLQKKVSQDYFAFTFLNLFSSNIFFRCNQAHK